jgi:Xaa-Pro aminopeptidase
MIYQERRARLAAQLGAGGIAIIPTAPERPRNRDSDFPYRHDSYFYYLTGFTEPGACLVLAHDGRSHIHNYAERCLVLSRFGIELFNYLRNRNSYNK